MLFDIESDPHEQEDLAESNPQACKDAAYLLSRWHDDMMKTMPCPTDPLRTVIKEGGPYHARGMLKDYCEFLQDTERSSAIEALKKKHPGEFGAVINPRDYSEQALMESLRKKLLKKFGGA
jgi:hypothetical protein